MPERRGGRSWTWALVAIGAVALLVVGVGWAVTATRSEPETPDLKPVIYLYPTSTQDVDVALGYAGDLDLTYPQADDGRWRVQADPDGTLRADGREYPYLFWEGTSTWRADLSTGAVVPGDQTVHYLERTLADLGLSDAEAADFITFWAPRMQGSAYNLVHFSQQAEYATLAELTVDPAPDTVIRVFMTFQPLDDPDQVDVREQVLDPAPARDGFVVVEWGGTEVPAP